MDINTPSFVLEAIKKRLTHPIIGYEEVPLSAKEAQIAWLLKHHDIIIDPKFMLFSHSVVASLSVAIKSFAKEDEEVIVQTPIYPPFFKQVMLNKRKLLLNPLKESNSTYTMDLEHLKRSITPKTKLLLLCNPHNPVGRSWSYEELEELVTLCHERGITIFSDEIHSDLVLSPKHKHTSIFAIPKAKEIALAAYGVGKSFNMAGFAISSVVAQDETLLEQFQKEYEAIHFDQPAVLSQVAFEAAYKEGDAWLKALKAHLWHNYKRLEATLKPYSNLIKLTPLEATYLAWLDCRAMGLKDKALREWFIKECKLGLNPGISFGRVGSGFMRLNFGVSSEIMDEIIKRLEKGLQSYGN